jgi:hypothetical protein
MKSSCEFGYESLCSIIFVTSQAVLSFIELLN